MRLREVGTTGGVERGICAVLREGRRVLAREDLERALRLLLASGGLRLRLELCGDGIWELGRVWRRPLEEARREADRQGRELLISLRADSAPWRPLEGALRSLDARVVLPASTPARELGRLRRAEIDALLELALRPEDLPRLEDLLRPLAAAGTPAVRLRPVMGLPWPSGSAERLTKAIGAWLEELNQKVGDRPQPVQVMNLFEEASPELLADSLRLGPGGHVSWKCADDHHRVWPGLRGRRKRAHVSELKGLGGLFMAPKARALWARSRLRGDGRRLWNNNLHLGLLLASFFRRPLRGYRDRSENATIKRGLITADFKTQDRFLKLRLPGVDRLFYFLRSGCVNDCIFCKRKVEDPGQSVAEVSAALRQNRRLKRKRLAFLGNEPLLNPELPRMIRAARRCGFADIEVMTSGSLLSDRRLARSLVKAGATSFPIPVYSSDAAEHDALVKHPGSFREIMKAVENLLSLGAGIYLHTNLMKQNIRAIPGMERMALRELKLPFSALPVRPKDPDSMNLPYGALAPSYKEILRSVRARTLAAFPVCVMGRIQRPAVLPASRIADSIKLYVLHQNFVKPESCAGCPEYGRCVGTFREQLDEYPDDAGLLKP